MNRKILLMLLIAVLTLSLFACDSYSKKYISENEIEFQTNKDSATDFSEYYIDILKGYYYVSNNKENKEQRR